MKIFNSLLLVLAIQWSITSNAQTTAPNEQAETGKVSGTLFTEFNSTLNRSNNKSALEVKRAYLGYSRVLGQGFSAEVKIDIGSPDDASAALHRRFAYFKTAALYYNYKKLRVEFGMVSSPHLLGSDKFWNKRYISQPFMDEYNFTHSADLGVKAIYSFSKSVSVDFSLLNGEGYSSLQNDSSYKSVLGLTTKPFDGFVGRLYTDIEPKKVGLETVTQKTYSLFAGQSIQRYHLGVEYTYQYNYQHNKNRDRYGYSILGKVDVTEKINILGRFDSVCSKIEVEKNNFELLKDGHLIIGGAEYIVSNYVRFSLNYRQWTSTTEGEKREPSLHASIEVKF